MLMALFEEPEGGEGLPALDRTRRRCSSEWFTSQQGFSVGPTKDLGEPPGVGARTRSCCRSGPRRDADRYAGHAGPSSRKAAEAVTKYIVADMYAKAVQGMAPEEAVKWAHGELVKIYA